MTDPKKTVILKQEEHEIIKVDIFSRTPPKKDEPMKLISFKYIPYGDKVMSVNMGREKFCKNNGLNETDETEKKVKESFKGKTLSLINQVI